MNLFNQVEKVCKLNIEIHAEDVEGPVLRIESESPAAMALFDR